jgi:hypothetical protein
MRALDNGTEFRVGLRAFRVQMGTATGVVPAMPFRLAPTLEEARADVQAFRALPAYQWGDVVLVYGDRPYRLMEFGADAELVAL